MSARGQKRRLDGRHANSGLPRLAWAGKGSAQPDLLESANSNAMKMIAGTFANNIGSEPSRSFSTAFSLWARITGTPYFDDLALKVTFRHQELRLIEARNISVDYPTPLRLLLGQVIRRCGMAFMLDTLPQSLM
jgi:hypothetical protein